MGNVLILARDLKNTAKRLGETHTWSGKYAVYKKSKMESREVKYNGWNRVKIV